MGFHSPARCATADGPPGRKHQPTPLLLFAGFCSLVIPGLASASTPLYECLEESGRRVLTDRPAQLRNCTRVATEEYTAPESSAETPGHHSSTPSAPTEAVTPQPERLNGAVTIPVSQVGHMLVVTARMNGARDAQLILDTGASHTILSRELAYELGMLPAPNAPWVTLKTAGGQVQAEMVRVDSIRLADAEVQHSLAAVYDIPDVPQGVEGLLGLTFFHQFEVTLDTAKGLLLLRPHSK